MVFFEVLVNIYNIIKKAGIFLAFFVYLPK